MCSGTERYCAKPTKLFLMQTFLPSSNFTTAAHMLDSKRLNKQILETPTWLLDPKILDNISSPTTDQIGSIQNSIISSLLSSARLARMNTASARFQNAYKLDEYF